MKQLRKAFFYAFMAIVPISATAQKNANKPTTDGRQIALLDENVTPDNVTIRGGTKEVSPDTLLIHSNSLDLLKGLTTENQDSNKILTEESETPKFAEVPLIGELDYYGKNNDYLINYCASYINNFGRRLVSVQNKEKTFETIEEILGNHKIPKELEYLAVIESALNGNARSPVGAVGYWQFMSPTARRMGLVVNRHRDDRKNLTKSTEAAAKYLSYLYSKFDDWLLVVAAYNCGGGRLQQAITSAGGGEKGFWQIKQYLPKETQNHVLAFVATATIMEKLTNYIGCGLPEGFDWSTLNYSCSKEFKPESNVADVGVPLIKRFGIHEVREMALVKIDKPINLQILASIIKASPNLITRWNYDYFNFKSEFKKGKTYNLKIPKDKLDVYFANINYIQSASNRIGN